jgi:putative FmdB family regulatory protein
MPTYEYRCPNGHEFEHFFRKISDAQASLPCPTCQAIAARQMSGGAGLVFKGSGFYITDYGKDGKKDQRKNGATTSSSSDSKPAAEGKPAESKPAESKPTGGTGPAKSE